MTKYCQPREHEWIWCCEICNETYCGKCYKSFDFDEDEVYDDDDEDMRSRDSDRGTGDEV